MLGPIRVGEQRFLRRPALVPQRVQLPGIDAVPVALEPLLHQARQRQIHVVAAEEDVIADGDALEREIAVVFGNENEAEIRRAAADIAGEHQVTDTQLPAPGVAGHINPGVAGGLRFFEQRDISEAGGVRGAQRQLARVLVE